MAKVINWTAEELAWIKANKALPRRDAHAKFIAKFNKPDIKLGAYTALCKRNKWFTGRTGCFPPGSTPANKGKKMPYNANSAATRFKKGHVPANAQPVGYESITRDGYVQLLIAEENPHTGADRRFVLKHRYLWEQVNGKVPAGHALKCIDGNQQNCAPENWECVGRDVMVRLNQMQVDYAAAPDELKPALITLAKLKAKSGKMKKTMEDSNANS